MTTRQGPPPKAADKTPQEVQNMAPAERDAYLQKRAEEGVDPGSWLFGPVQQWIAQAKEKNQAREMANKNVAKARKGPTSSTSRACTRPTRTTRATTTP